MRFNYCQQLLLGATSGVETNSPEVVCSTTEGAYITSGGGFSNLEAVPSWQAPFISNYFKSLPPDKKPLPGYNVHGRGYPDVSMAGRNYETLMNGTCKLLLYILNVVVVGQTWLNDGTSASTPVFAGMIALVNAARLAAGLSTLGWINPMLYANYKSFILNDITSGDNKCSLYGATCSTNGFYAAPGW